MPRDGHAPGETPDLWAGALVGVSGCGGSADVAVPKDGHTPRETPDRWAGALVGVSGCGGSADVAVPRDGHTPAEFQVSAESEEGQLHAAGGAEGGGGEGGAVGFEAGAAAGDVKHLAELFGEDAVAAHAVAKAGFIQFAFAD